VIFGVPFGYTGADFDIVALDFAGWAYLIPHEHWSRIDRKQQNIVGTILSNTHYWCGMLLPVDADFSAGLTRREYDADIPYKSESDSETYLD
jgi:hypothetical protein